ncbi:DgyrCDS7890 [Dimorphilus gyrociliatus]|uniref:DgyrCDS7890 n=1 Tax=Dimorphilus gyrociliatus TaxID=2664684 RepID=A0A7I8VSL6_9ANNE|nr:DgyrCDS7890 [Dimorphilus gyrociliatus]
METSPELKKLFEEYPEFSLIEGGRRIKCNLSGHEMPPNIAAVEAYMKGKKYKKLIAAAQMQIPKEFEDHLEPSTKAQSKGKLFCKLTWRHINNVPGDILRHVQGKRFQRQLTRWKRCQETGTKFEARPHRNKNKDIGDLNGEFEKVHIRDDDDGNESDGSNLSDLYPHADFDSDSDWEDMSDGETEQPKAAKRKLNQSIAPKRKKVQKK